MPNKTFDRLSSEGIVLYGEEQYEAAFLKFTLAANEGCTEAEYMLGVCYSKGNGTELNQLLALEWYEKAAKKGYVPAQLKLGYYYHFTRGDYYKQAFYWFQKAAKAGNPKAQEMVGYYYLEGYYVKKDCKTALQWFHRSAQQRHPYALYLIGTCYEHGEGVEKDPTKAIEWYAKAAEFGEEEAMCRLGHCYRYGWGVEVDMRVAISYYEDAAMADAPEAWDCLDELSAKGYMEAKEALSRLKGE